MATDTAHPDTESVADPVIDDDSSALDFPEPVTAWPGGTDHKTIGRLFIAAGLLFLLGGGVLGLLLRGQLAAPDQDLLTPDRYRYVFTYHGLIMVFLFLLPAWLGVASVMVPLQVGTTRLAFPRLHAVSFWVFVVGGGLVVASPFLDGPTASGGWALDSPIPVDKPFFGESIDLLVLGLIAVAFAGILVAVNLLVTVVQQRVPGLTLARLPLFTWSVAVSSSVLLLALPVVLGAFTILFVDRHFGGQLFRGFTGSRGGSFLAWPRLIWFGLYPMMWALLLPALGAACEVVAVAARRVVVGRKQVFGAFAILGVLAFVGWGPAVGNLSGGRILFAVGRLAALGPLTIVVLAALGTVAMAARSRRSGPSPVIAPSEARRRFTPLLFILGMASVLGVGMLGGLGAAVGGPDFQRTYWAVGTQHLLFFGPSLLGLVAALHYWAPKLFGRHLSKNLAALEALLITAGLHLAFIPALVLGLQDMPRRLPVLGDDTDWEIANAVSAAGAGVLALGALVLVVDLLGVFRRSNRSVGDDPWNGHTLEWATSSPPPAHDFDTIPEVRSETPVLDLATAGARAGGATPDRPEGDG